MGLSKEEALLYAFTFLVAGIGSDVVFGQLLKRQYRIARNEYRRDGSPMWWTWKPPDATVRWPYNRAPRWRWLFYSTPKWVYRDTILYRLHIAHRSLAWAAIAAWLMFLLRAILSE